MTEFTGERYVPAVKGEIRQEHLHRYAWCAQLVTGRDVLDVASGEGYGSAMLARSARSVVGVDVSAEAIACAQEKYKEIAGLRYVHGSADQLPLPEACVDVVVSFETIEHLTTHEEMVREIRRVLRPDGFLVISSPNKRIYSDQAGYHNEFHVKELYLEELDALLRRHFPAVEYLGQRVAVASTMARLQPDETVTGLQGFTDAADAVQPRVTSLAEPVYYVAVAAARPSLLPPITPSVLHSEGEDLHEHYRRLARWAQDQDSEIQRLSALLRKEQAHSGEVSQWALQLEGQLNAAGRVAGAPLLAPSAAARMLPPDAPPEVLQRHVVTLESENEAYRREIAVLQQRIDAHARSLSWRSTRPLRFIGRVARGDWESVVDGLRRSGLGQARVLQPLKPIARKLLRMPAIQEKSGFGRLVQNLPPIDTSGRVGALSLPLHDHPLVSVIIPAYGQLPHTLTCLQSIARNLPTVPFEVIVAEDASGDQAMEVLRQVPGLRYIEHPENLGFLRSCNRAAQAARGEYLFFLNNDTQVTPDWLDALVEIFRTHPDAGMAGSRLIYPDGRLQEAGGILWRDGSAWNFGRTQDPDGADFNYVKEADYISGAAIMVPSALFTQLGGFDELFAPAYCEDSDLAFRIRASGRKVYYQPRSTVVHYEGISHGTDVSQGLKSYQVANQKKLVEHWGAVLRAEHLENGSHVFLAKDRSQLKKTLLIVDHYCPQPDRDAGSRTMWQFIRIFLQQGFSVKFWPENLQYDPVYTPRLQQLGVEVIYGPEHVGGFRQWVAEHGQYLDYVLLSRPHISLPFIEPLRRYSGARLLFYGHDVHHLRMREQARLKPGPELERAAEAMEATERQVWQAVDTIYYPSESETQYVQAALAGAADAAAARTVPPYAFETLPHAPAENLRERMGLLFVAGFAHPPNIDAALWLVREVLPLVRRQYPGMPLTLVGSSPSEEVRRLDGSGVEVTGFVPDDDLERRYRNARVAVAPLRFGAGVKGKVVEAMRFGVPCVTTAVGAQGLESAGAALAVADSPEEFAAAVCRLLESDPAWVDASRQAQAYVREHFSEQAVWRVFAQDMDAAPFANVHARPVLQGARREEKR